MPQFTNTTHHRRTTRPRKILVSEPSLTNLEEKYAPSLAILEQTLSSQQQTHIGCVFKAYRPEKEPHQSL